MKLGAVAMLDVLGFKGIWKGATPKKTKSRAAEVLECLRAAARVPKIYEFNQDLDTTPSTVMLHSTGTLLSDTFVITMSYCEEETKLPHPRTHILLENICLVKVIEYSAQFQRALLEGAIGLNVRGAITLGKFIVDETLIIGPAIDNVAQLEKEPDGAFIWLSHSAEQSLGAFRKEYGDVQDDLKYGLIRHEMPLNNGKVIPALLINPFDGLDEEGRNELINSSNRAFESEDLGVRIKAANTKKFFDHCATVISVPETSSP